MEECRGHYARHLSAEEIEKLKKDATIVSEFKQKKLELEAQKNWDLFYKRNERNFFKDRHWTTREFQELISHDSTDQKTSSSQVLLEVGCGVGNFIFPLIAEKTRYFVYACDFSKRAVDFVKSHPLYSSDVCSAFQCDVSTDSLSDHIQENSVDIVSLIFVLSSIHPDKMKLVLQNIWKVMKVGGILLFRDYGLYDQAMLRFSAGHKLANNFYVRQDGTRAYYFSEEFSSQLFTSASFEVVENVYVQRETVNKKESICVPRIFLQGKFRKIVCNGTEQELATQG